MTAVVLALNAGVVLSTALCWAIHSLVAGCRRDRRRRRAEIAYLRRGAQTDHERPIHLFRGQGEAVTVAELLEDAAELGEGIRLNWPADDLHASPIRPDPQGQFPTVILPRIEDPEVP